MFLSKGDPHEEDILMCELVGCYPSSRCVAVILAVVVFQDLSTFGLALSVSLLHHCLHVKGKKMLSSS